VARTTSRAMTVARNHRACYRSILVACRIRNQR
jgi:hypothetical protein